MTALVTTLNKIRECSPCGSGWTKLLKHLNKTDADDEPLPFGVIVESNGLDDALWCMRAAPEHRKEWRLFAVWCARRVTHLMTDPRSLAAIDVAERFAHGNATNEEWAAAGDAAWAAAWAAAGAAAGDAAWAAAWDAAGDAAMAAARDAAWAAAGAAAWAAAGDAAGDAARAAARDAAWAAARAAAWAAAGDAAGDAAWAAAGDAQKTEFLRIVSGE